MSDTNTHRPSFAIDLLGKAVLVLTSIIVVWGIFAYLAAYRLEWLGYVYGKLQPLTLALFNLVERVFSGDVRYKIRAAITDDLGQRSLFLLLLTAVVELTLYSLFKLVKMVFFERRSA